MHVPAAPWRIQTCFEIWGTMFVGRVLKTLSLGRAQSQLRCPWLAYWRSQQVVTAHRIEGSRGPPNSPIQGPAGSGCHIVSSVDPGEISMGGDLTRGSTRLAYPTHHDKTLDPKLRGYGGLIRKRGSLVAIQGAWQRGHCEKTTILLDQTSPQMTVHLHVAVGVSTSARRETRSLSNHFCCAPPPRGGCSTARPSNQATYRATALLQCFLLAGM